MTLTELAREMGLSRQTIYNRCKKAGLSIDTLTDETAGSKKLLTVEGEKALRELLQSGPVDVKDELTEQKNKKLLRKLDEKGKQLTEAENRTRELEAENASLRDRLNQLEAEKQRQGGQIDTLTELLRNQQILTAQAQETARNLSVQQRKGLFYRLFRIGAGREPGKDRQQEPGEPIKD